MKANVWTFLGGALYMLAALGVAYLGIAISDRMPPTIFESARALEASVPQGGSIDIEYQIYRWRMCTTYADRDIVDAQGKRHAINEFTRGLSQYVGRETYTRSITIPDNAAVGPARYEVRIRYYCNPIHRLGFPILVQTPDVLFTITPGVSIVPWGLPNQSG